MDACSSLLQNYGGHQKAAGLSLSKENLVAFTQKFTDLADEALAGQDPRKEIPLAALLSEDSLNVKLVRDLRIFEPYGEGFPEPIFGLVARPDSVRYMGAEQQHAKLLCSQNNLAIIAWNMASKVWSMSRLPGKFIGKPELNIWRGSVTVQFIQSSSN